MIPQLDTLGRTAVLRKIISLKIQLLGYGLVTKIVKRSMSPKQTGSKMSALHVRVSPRQVDINGRVVPIATAERSLIPRQKDVIRQCGLSWEQKGPLFDLTVATDQSMVYSKIICTIDVELNRSCHCNGVHGIAIKLQPNQECDRYEVSYRRPKKISFLGQRGWSARQ
ncbi:MAG: hypothetical protein EZS28_040286 [Streblomastix strix]|uniref:Uncharacterized protein n=1 Tax=Streblomastix strix TaxID=222440 RepID=A0A5J4U0W5_9EUKA|nr:MAG: hypothetical protein EZS28_040286 [Streblomastix strix]